MVNIKESLKKFYDICKRKNIKNKLIKGVPYIGESLYALINEGDIEDLIREVQAQSESNQKEIITKIEILMKDFEKPISPIVVFGSGNGEHLFRYEGRIQLGHKHSAEVEELFGGSGVNYAFRLLKTGNPILPVLSIGNDRLGKKIRDEILKSCRKTNLSEGILSIIDNDAYFVHGLKTPAATILSDGMTRTIFSQNLCGIKEYDQFLENILDRLDSEFTNPPSVVIIGHIHGDNKKCRTDAICTKKIVDKFRNKSLIYANFGNSQIEYGIDYWEHTLESIDIFQLNLYEMKKIFRQSGKKFSLLEIIDWFRERKITAIVTINRFGAVATYKGGGEGIIWSWPFKIKSNILEPTGAGDAFGAGMVSCLYKARQFSHDDFSRAIKTGRIWGAYACTTPGGSKDCPDQTQIDYFIRENTSFEQKPVETRDRNEVVNFLSLFDEIDEHNLYFNLLKGA